MCASSEMGCTEIDLPHVQSQYCKNKCSRRATFQKSSQAMGKNKPRTANMLNLKHDD